MKEIAETPFLKSLIEKSGLWNTSQANTIEETVEPFIKGKSNYHIPTFK
ncbi:hypothetical protein [Desulfurobacterium sp.]